MKLTVSELTPSLRPAVEELFGKSGACGGCWCQWWRIEKGEKWGQVKGATAKKRLEEQVGKGAVMAVLAFDGDSPVGWCTFGPRLSFPRLGRSRTLKCDDPEAVWSLPCFFVRRDYRGKGIAGAMLEASLKIMKRRGAALAEGYPSKPCKDGTYIAAFSWTGTFSLFEKAGFEIVGNTDSGKVRMRKRLR